MDMKRINDDDGNNNDGNVSMPLVVERPHGSD